MLLTLIALAGLAHAGSEVGTRPFGLGIILGEPTGLSAKLYLGGPRNAVDFALAFDTYGTNRGGWFWFHATYLIHPSVLAAGSGVEVPWHVGVGGYVISDQFRDNQDRDVLGVRVPIGVDVNLTEFPLQFFGDISLDVDLIPATDIGLGLGIGARYYF
jgi:hypothetical protein